MVNDGKMKDMVDNYVCGYCGNKFKETSARYSNRYSVMVKRFIKCNQCNNLLKNKAW